MVREKKQLLTGIIIGAGLVSVLLGGWWLVTSVSMPTAESLRDGTFGADEATELIEAFVPEEASEVTSRVDDVITGMVDTVAPASEADLADPFPTPLGAPTFLSDSQRAALEAVGVDTSTLPTTLTPELEACFVTAIGRERVDAVIAGDTPSIMEMLKAKHCLE